MSQQTKPVAIVTGASRGIGAATAHRLAADGYAIVVNYANNAVEAENVANALRASGATAIAVKADVANADDVRAMFDTAESELGKVDVLVNNAGIMKNQPVADTSDALFAQTFAVNVQGTFNTLREAAQRMSSGGRVVNFSSSALALNLPSYAVYNATKAAVESFTHVFAKELRGKKIRVNAVAPGPIATELFLDGKTPEQIRQFAMMSPLERLGEPEDIARVVSFLVGPDAGWINGQVLRANGGLA